MKLWPVKVPFSYGENKTDVALVDATVSMAAQHGGLTYEQIAQIYEDAASQVRAFASAHPEFKAYLH